MYFKTGINFLKPGKNLDFISYITENITSWQLQKWSN